MATTDEAFDSSDSSAALSPERFLGRAERFPESRLMATSAVRSIDEDEDEDEDEDQDPAVCDEDSDADPVECDVDSERRMPTAPTARTDTVNRPAGFGLIECLIDVADDARRRRSSSRDDEGPALPLMTIDT